MTFLRTRLVKTAALLGLASAGFACSAILAARDDVQRCNTADDCDETGDPRYVAECRFDEANLDEDSLDYDKVCIAAYKIQGCDPNSIQGKYLEAYTALNTPSRYACDDAMILRGCPPPAAMTCEDGGMVMNQLGVCDVEANPSNPAYTGLDLPGQDVLDAFCQSFFCEGEWVCDEDFSCVRCDPELPPGQGGCGTLFTQGAPSCVYPADPSCGDGNTSVDDPRFGCST